MEKHLAVLVVCLQSCLVSSTSAMPVPATEDMKATAASLFEITRKQAERASLLPANTNPNSNINADNLILKNDETEDSSGDAAVLRHMADTRTNPGKNSLIQEEKRRLRLVKRREASYGKTLGQQTSNRHSLHKRETGYRDRRTWSISNALSVITDMVVAHEQARLAEERAEMKRRLLELGKRSEDSGPGKTDTFNRKDQDIVSFLQAALSSSESN